MVAIFGSIYNQNTSFEGLITRQIWIKTDRVFKCGRHLVWNVKTDRVFKSGRHLVWTVKTDTVFKSGRHLLWNVKTDRVIQI